MIQSGGGLEGTLAIEGPAIVTSEEEFCLLYKVITQNEWWGYHVDAPCKKVGISLMQACLWSL